MNINKVLIGYFPVIMTGHKALFEKYRDSIVYVIDEEIKAQVAKKLTHYARDINALPAKDVVTSILAMKYHPRVQLATVKEMENVHMIFDEVAMPDEDISKEIKKLFFPEQKVIFDREHFLRWHKRIQNEEKSINFDEEISQNEFDKRMMLKAYTEAQRSGDWWRQIGAVIVKDGNVLSISHNRNWPFEQVSSWYGCMRSPYVQGEYIDQVCTFHAEKDSIVRIAAQKGKSTKGASVYVTTFPCPDCARAMAVAEIKEVYYSEGYSLRDAEEVLKCYGIKVTRVVLEKQKAPAE